MTEALVLLPGLLNDARLFQAQRGLASDIVIPELWHEDTVAALAQRVLEAAPERFALVGFSMGGYVALEILRQARARVTRLALIDTSARADSEEQRKRRLALISQSAIGEFKGVTARLLPLLVHKDRLNDAPLVATLQAMAQTVGRDGFVRQQRAILSRPDSRAELKAIDVPTAVICGREDAVTPLAHSQEIAAGIKNAKLTVIEACGHVSPLERPEAVNAVLQQWLVA